MRLRLSLLLIVAICLPGCASLVGYAAGSGAPHTLYFGTKIDLDEIRNGRLFWLADLPLSATLDTILLPGMAYENYRFYQENPEWCIRKSKAEAERDSEQFALQE